MTAIKICGIRDERDIEACASADYHGFIVHTVSPRCLTVERAKALVDRSRSQRVMVTSERDIDLISKMAEEIGPDIVQLHRPSDRAEIASLKERTGLDIWAQVTADDAGFDAIGSVSECCDCILLDKKDKNDPGTIDLDMARLIVEAVHPLRTIIAGGLTPVNIADVVRKVRPFAVDVASGVETAGSKDPRKVEEFIERARRAVR